MDNTNAQRQARWRQRQKTRSESGGKELAEAQARIAALETALKQAQAPADTSREVVRLKKENKELRSELADMTRWYEDVVRMLRNDSNGKMPVATFRAIAKCLHPDYTPSADERENACKLFNVYIESTRKK